jgi:hypothetical protein
MILTVIVVFVIVIVYTSYLWFSRKNELQTWTTSLLTTLVSVLLGVVTAVFLLTYQDSSVTDARRAQLIAMVSIELANNSRYLLNEGYSLQIENKAWKYRSSYLRHQAIDAAALSGIFKDQQAKDLFILADNIFYYNTLIDSIDRLYTITPINYRMAMAAHLYQNQQIAYAAMGPNLAACRRSLGLE